jgi:hypothetical protein
MTVKELRERWPERDCAVGFPGVWWVRFGDRWYLLPKEVGEEDLPAGQKSGESMLRTLAGYVMRCACCGAIYSPGMAVYGLLGGCRTLVAEQDFGPVGLAEMADLAASLMPGERSLVYLGLDGRKYEFAGGQLVAIDGYDLPMARPKLADLGVRWVALHTLGGRWVFTLGHRDFVVRREVPASMVPEILAEYF